jgi:hypothetical protein
MRKTVKKNKKLVLIENKLINEQLQEPIMQQANELQLAGMHYRNNKPISFARATQHKHEG